MTIVDKIINSIHAALDWDETVSDGNGGNTTVHHTFPVYYHDDPTLNLMTSDMDFPCALVQLLTQGRIVQEGGQAKEVVSAAIFFVEPSQFDFDAVENEAIIDRCKDKAMTWLLSLPASEYIQLAELTRTTRVYDRYDDILTGYGLLADIQELNGIC